MREKMISDHQPLLNIIRNRKRKDCTILGCVYTCVIKMVVMIYLVDTLRVKGVIVRLSQALWTTTPRSTVNQELKLLTKDLKLSWLGW